MRRSWVEMTHALWLFAAALLHVALAQMTGKDVHRELPNLPQIRLGKPIDCSAKADVVFVLDSSSSVGQAHFDKMLAFVTGMLADANIDDGRMRIGAMTYSTDTQVHFQLHQFKTKRDVLKAVKGIRYQPGSSNMADALQTLRTQMFNPANGERVGIPNIAILITDGPSNLNSERTIPEALKTHDAEVHIFVVGVGIPSGGSEIQALVSSPAEENTFIVKTFDELSEIKRIVFAKLCETVIIDDHSSNELPNIAAVLSDRECRAEADVAFLVDSSTSVREPNFHRILRFIANLVMETEVDAGNFRFALVTYSRDVIMHFGLREYTSKERLVEAILAVPYMYGSSNMADGLKALRTHVFRYRSGDRPNVANVAVLVTDGSHNVRARHTLAEARKLKQLGVTLMAVGVGLRKVTEINELVTQPANSHAVLIRGYGQLKGLRNKLFKRICAAGRLDLLPKPLHKEPDSGLPVLPPAVDTIDCKGRVDVVFVLDSSGSVGKDNFITLLKFVTTFVQPLHIGENGYQVGLMTFSDDARVVFHLNSHKSTAAVLSALEDVKYVYGSTNTADALRSVRTQMFTKEHGDRPDVPNVCFFVTDGLSNIQADLTLVEARLLHTAGVAVVGIGVGLTETREIRGISSSPASKFMYLVDHFEELGKFAPKLIKPLCSDADACMGRPCKNNGSCVTALDHYLCRCDRGHTGATCQRSCSQPADVVFLLDSSGSVGEQNFRLMKQFIRRIVQEINVQNCRYRIGVLKFGSSPFVQFNLNTYNTSDDLQTAIDNIGYSYGFTATADALKMVRQEMFVKAKGDRPKVRDIIVLLTDGLANVRTRNTLREVRAARAAGIHVVPIGVAVGGAGEMKTMASDPIKGTFFAPSFQQLESLHDELVQYLLEDKDQCRPNPCRRGGRCEDRINGFVCFCKPGYSGKTCQTRCQAQSDVAFLVDTSQNIVQSDFDKVREFMLEIVEKLKLYDGQSRVAIITFSGRARIERTLKETTNKEDIYAAVDHIEYEGGFPFMADAFDIMVHDVFKKNAGDRPDVPNFAILITGGLKFSEYTLPLAYKAQEQGVHVFGIGIGLSPTEALIMNRIATKPDVYKPRNVNRLDDIVDRIVAKLCEDNDQCDSNPCRNQGKCIDLASGYLCQCQEGFSGANCERGCNEKADLVFILDSSGSVGRENFAKMTVFVNSVVGEMNIGPNATRVGLVSFSSRPHIAFPLNRYTNTEDLKRGVYSVPYRYGDTFTADALRVTRDYIFQGWRGDRSDIINVAVIITDGVSNIRNWRTIPEAHRAKDAGIHIFAVGIGLANVEEVYAIASEPHRQNTFLLGSFDELQDVTATLVSAICGDANTCSKNPCKHDGKCITVANSYKCECADGYSGQNCERNCNTVMDIAFLVDSSTSVGEENFSFVRKFLQNVIKPLEFASGKTRVSVVTFNNNAVARFFLDTHQSRGDVQHAMHFLTYTQGATFTADALRVMREDVFNSAQGDRTGAPNLAILITDGVSNVLPQTTIPQAKRAIREGIEMYGIGIALNSTDEIYAVVPNKKNVLLLSKYAELENMTDTLVDMFCSRGNTRGFLGDEAIGGGSISTSEGPGCDDESDIVFLLDSSGSLTQTHFEKVLSFVAYLTRLIGMQRGQTRVGVVTYNTGAKIQFHLREHTTSFALSKAIMAIPYIPGETNMAEAIHRMREEMFQRDSGDRPGVPNIGVLITDGLSTVDPPQTVIEADKANKKGIQLFTIGIGIEDFDELELVAKAKQRVFAAEDFDHLMTIAGAVKDAICKGMREAPLLDTTNQCLSNPCQNDGLCIDGDYKYTCQCLPGHSGINCQTLDLLADEVR